MILHNNREMDTRFVARTMQEHQLKPVPLEGFHSKAHYWQETARWRRVVEEYQWGMVIFMDDRERGVHATVVAVGKMDLTTGRVMRNGHPHQLPVGWYSDLVKGLKDVHKQTEMAIPPCLGFHEGDHICDGGINQETKKAEPACRWRERCIALQSYCLEQNRYVEDILRGKSPEAIVQITIRLVEKQHPAALSVPPTPTEQRPQQGAKKHDSVEATQALVGVVRSVAIEVAEASGVVLAADPSLARRGDLYLVDRTTNTDYVSLYQVTAGKPQPICSFRLRRRLGGFRVQLPLDKDSPLLGGIVKSDVVSWKDGAFKVAVNDVTPGSNRMSHIVNILTNLISSVQGKAA